jgi:hypothetical protein
MNYTTLTGAKTLEGSIRNWVNRIDIPATTILTEAEAWIYERLRVREMQAELAFVFAEGESSEALPDDFLDPIQLVPYLAPCATPLPLYDLATFPRLRDADGALYEAAAPCGWTIIGETAHIDCLMEADYGCRLTYYARPAALAASSNETNFLTRRYPTLLRYACQGKALEHMKNPGAKDYFLLAEEKLQEAARTNDLYRRGMYVPA